MARARKSHAAGEEKTKARKAQETGAYSSRVDGHKYVIYATLARDEELVGKVLVLKFLGTFAAQRMAKQLIGRDEFTWELWNERDAMIVTSRGVKIRAHEDQLKEVMAHEPTEEEIAWRDDQLTAACNRFLWGRNEFSPADQPAADDGDDEREDEVERTTDAEPAARVKQERPAKPDPKPRVDTSGMVTANDIAKKLGVEGREVRGVLRAMKLEKPAHGWAFDKKTAADIEAKVTAGLKAAKKGKKK